MPSQRKKRDLSLIVLLSCGLIGCDLSIDVDVIENDTHDSSAGDAGSSEDTGLEDAATAPELDGAADADGEDASDDAPNDAAPDAAAGGPVLPCAAPSPADDNVLFELGNCGKINGIAGAPGRVVVATAGGILAFDLRSGRKTLEGFLPIQATRSPSLVRTITLSNDGAVLFAPQTTALPAGPAATQLARLISMPDGQTIRSWDPWSVGYPPALMLAKGGTRVGTTQCDTAWGICQRWVTDLLGEMRYFNAPFGPGNWLSHDVSALSLSPDGSLVAAPDNMEAGSETKIYRDGSLVGAVRGWAVDWIDDSRLLVQTHIWLLHPNGPFEEPRETSMIVDPEGNLLASPKLPEIPDFLFDTVDATRIYVPVTNTIYSLADGSSVWTSPPSHDGLGAIAGPYVVYAASGRVFIEEY
jgi:hypothetical protein